MDNMVKQYVKVAGTVTDVVSEGNVVINVPGATLKDVTISGDLIIGDGVGNGNITLDNVTVQGDLIARGGGVNSIIIVGGSVEGKIVVSKVDGQIRVSVEGGAEVEVIVVDDGQDDVILEGTIGTVEITAAETPVLVRNANIQQVTIAPSAIGSSLHVSGTVSNLTVQGQGATVTASSGGTITNVTSQSDGVTITGTGNVGTVIVEGNNTTINTNNTSVTLDTGVVGTIINDEPQDTPTQPTQVDTEPTPPPAGGGGGTPSPTVLVAEIEVTSTAIEITVDNGTLSMTAVVSPAGATNQNVTWSVSGAAATINSSGLLTAITNGAVTVFAVAQDGSGVSGQLEITISGQVPDIVDYPTIAGVEMPAKWGSPDIRITETDQFTGTISWSPDDSPFGSSTSYTATITLTAKDGYTLTGIANNFFIVPGATTVSSVGHIVTAQYPVTDPPEYSTTGALAIDSIAVTYGATSAEVLGRLGTLIPTVSVSGTLDGESDTATITWISITNYSGTSAGAYTATGTLTLPTDWIGTPGSVTATVNVSTAAYESADGLTASSIYVTYGATSAQAIALLDTSVGINGTNGERGTAGIVWNIAGYDATSAGAYTATGTLTLPNSWTGTGQVMATVNVSPAAYASTDALTTTSISVTYGATSAEALGLLQSSVPTVGVNGTNGEDGTATITWTAIAAYDATSPGSYVASGTLGLPVSWSGSPDVVTAAVIVLPQGDQSGFTLAVMPGAPTIEGIQFGLSITNADTTAGIPLTGEQTVVVSSQEGHLGTYDESVVDGGTGQLTTFSTTVEFEDGGGGLPIFISAPGIFHLTVTVEGITTSQSIEVVITESAADISYEVPVIYLGRTTPAYITVTAITDASGNSRADNFNNDAGTMFEFGLLFEDDPEQIPGVVTKSATSMLIEIPNPSLLTTPGAYKITIDMEDGNWWDIPFEVTVSAVGYTPRQMALYARFGSLVLDMEIEDSEGNILTWAAISDDVNLEESVIEIQASSGEVTPVVITFGGLVSHINDITNTITFDGEPGLTGLSGMSTSDFAIGGILEGFLPFEHDTVNVTVKAIDTTWLVTASAVIPYLSIQHGQNVGDTLDLTVVYENMEGPTLSALSPANVNLLPAFSTEYDTASDNKVTVAAMGGGEYLCAYAWIPVPEMTTDGINTLEMAYDAGNNTFTISGTKDDAVTADAIGVLYFYDSSTHTINYINLDFYTGAGEGTNVDINYMPRVEEVTSDDGGSTLTVVFDSAMSGSSITNTANYTYSSSGNPITIAAVSYDEGAWAATVTIQEIVAVGDLFTISNDNELVDVQGFELSQQQYLLTTGGVWIEKMGMPPGDVALTTTASHITWTPQADATEYVINLYKDYETETTPIYTTTVGIDGVLPFEIGPTIYSLGAGTGNYSARVQILGGTSDGVWLESSGSVYVTQMEQVTGLIVSGGVLHWDLLLSNNYGVEIYISYGEEEQPLITTLNDGESGYDLMANGVLTDSAMDYTISVYAAGEPYTVIKSITPATIVFHDDRQDPTGATGGAFYGLDNNAVEGQSFEEVGGYGVGDAIRLMFTEPIRYDNLAISDFQLSEGSTWGTTTEGAITFDDGVENYFGAYSEGIVIELQTGAYIASTASITIPEGALQDILGNTNTALVIPVEEPFVDSSGTTHASVDTYEEFESAMADEAIELIGINQDMSATTFAITRPIEILFDGHTLTGTVSITTSALGEVTLSAPGTIAGILMIDAPNLTVNNEVTVTGETIIEGVGYDSYNSSGSQGGGILVNGPARLNLSASATSATVGIDTSQMVVLDGSIQTVQLMASGSKARVLGTVTTLAVTTGAIGSLIEAYSGSSIGQVLASESTMLMKETGATVGSTTGAVLENVAYRVTFDKNGGDTQASPTYLLWDNNTETSNAMPTPPTKADFTFGGWNSQSHGGGTMMTTVYAVSSPVTAYAIWEAGDVEIENYDPFTPIDGGDVGTPAYEDATAVITYLESTLTCAAITGQSQVVPISGWVDTDSYTSSVAASYTFTASVGTLPEGFVDEISPITHVTVEVVVSVVEPPVITTITAVEGGSLAAGIDDGDIITIEFDVPTNFANLPSNPDTVSKEGVDSFIQLHTDRFGVTTTLGAAYYGFWETSTSFVITIDDSTGANFVIGDDISIKESAGLKTQDELSAASTSQAEVTGSFDPVYNGAVGLVKSPTGMAISGVEVYAGSIGSSYSDISDENGMYEIDYPTEGSITMFYVHDYWYDDVADNISAPNPGYFEKTMTIGAKITGTVTYGGSSAVGFTVKDSMAGTEAIVGADGSFNLRGVPSGTGGSTRYLNVLNLSGISVIEGSLIEVETTAFQTTSGVDIVIP
jgi:hypothetical protein